MILSYRFSRGEAAGAVVIKPLEEAVKDGDHIYGLVSRLLRA